MSWKSLFIVKLILQSHWPRFSKLARTLHSFDLDYHFQLALGWSFAGKILFFLALERCSKDFTQHWRNVKDSKNEWWLWLYKMEALFMLKIALDARQYFSMTCRVANKHPWSWNFNQSNFVMRVEENIEKYVKLC